MTTEPPGEPSRSELWRWMQKLQAEIADVARDCGQRLAAYVTLIAFEGERQRTQDRFEQQAKEDAELLQLIGEERAARVQAFQELKAAAEKAEERATVTRRWVVGIAVAGAGLVVTVLKYVQGALS